MTIQELIHELSKYSGDTKVRILSRGISSQPAEAVTLSISGESVTIHDED